MAQMPVPEHDFLWENFQKVDKDKSGRISVLELQQALTKGTWEPFDLETVKVMIKMFDKDHSGSISFKEFDSLWKYLIEWENCFRYYDRDNSKSINKRELSTALNKFGYHFSPPTVNAILAKFVRPGRSTFLYDDFIRCCLQLKNLKERFDKCDLDNDGVLTIQFEHLVEMVYNINI